MAAWASSVGATSLWSPMKHVSRAKPWLPRVASPRTGESMLPCLPSKTCP